MEWFDEWLHGLKWGDASAIAAWVIATASGVTGMVLGIRAEMRHRYRTTWVLSHDSTVTNRTGEDVANVRVFEVYEDGSPNRESYFRTVAPDESVSIPPVDKTRRLIIVWTRPSADRKLHVWPRSARSRTRRLRRHWRKVRAESRRADRRVAAL